MQIERRISKSGGRMGRLRWLGVLGVLVGLIGTSGERPHAQGPQGVFHTGATAGIVRDATKVGNTIYAVGPWKNPCADHDNNSQTACIVRVDGALWTFVGANAPTLTPLKD